MLFCPENVAVLQTKFTDRKGSSSGWRCCLIAPYWSKCGTKWLFKGKRTFKVLVGINEQYFSLQGKKKKKLCILKGKIQTYGPNAWLCVPGHHHSSGLQTVMVNLHSISPQFTERKKHLKTAA